MGNSRNTASPVLSRIAACSVACWALWGAAATSWGQSSPPAVRLPSGSSLRTPPSNPPISGSSGAPAARTASQGSTAGVRAPSLAPEGSAAPQGDATAAGATNSNPAGANPAGGAASPAGAANPNGAAAGASAGAAAGARPTTARVSRGTGVLPNNHGQIWREYDITPYTSRVEGTEKPEQAIVDWILRETGPEVWFGEPFGILNADKSTLRVYHIPDMQQLVSGIVDRFVTSEADAQVLGLRLATVGSPNWRTRAYTWLRPVEVKTPGVEAWLLSKENAVLLIAELSKRVDYRELNSPNLVIQNGQSQTVSRMRPKSYVKGVRPRDTVVAGYDSEMGQIDEGVSLQVSPLFALDGRSVDALIKCHIDQVERLVPVSIDLPGFGGQWQRAQIQVPQVASWRLHERFRWPTDQVLLLSCGVVAAPNSSSEGRGAASAIMGALSTTPGRADALLFVECNGKARGPAGQADTRQAAPIGTSYRGRY